MKINMSDLKKIVNEEIARSKRSVNETKKLSIPQLKKIIIETAMSEGPKYSSAQMAKMKRSQAQSDAWRDAQKAGPAKPEKKYARHQSKEFSPEELGADEDLPVVKGQEIEDDLPVVRGKEVDNRPPRRLAAGVKYESQMESIKAQIRKQVNEAEEDLAPLARKNR